MVEILLLLARILLYLLLQSVVEEEEEDGTVTIIKMGKTVGQVEELQDPGIVWTTKVIMVVPVHQDKVIMVQIGVVIFTQEEEVEQVVQVLLLQVL